MSGPWKEFTVSIGDQVVVARDPREAASEALEQIIQEGCSATVNGVRFQVSIDILPQASARRTDLPAWPGEEDNHAGHEAG